MRVPMSQQVKEQLWSIPKSICTICKSIRIYQNPMAKCSKCGEKHCFDHIHGVIEEKGVINYCTNCLKK